MSSVLAASVCMGNDCYVVQKCGMVSYSTRHHNYKCIGPFATQSHKHILGHLLCCHFGRPNHLSLLIKDFNASIQFTVPHQHHIAHATSGWRTREWGERSKQGYCQCCYNTYCSHIQWKCTTKQCVSILQVLCDKSILMSVNISTLGKVESNALEGCWYGIGVVSSGVCTGGHIIRNYNVLPTVDIQNIRT